MKHVFCTLKAPGHGNLLLLGEKKRQKQKEREKNVIFSLSYRFLRATSKFNLPRKS